MNDRSYLFWGLVALAVGIVLSAAVGSWAVRDIKRAGDTIVVTGSATKPIRADYVVWRGQVSSQQTTMQDAYGDVSRHVDRIREFFRAKGVPDTILTFMPVQTNPVNEVSERGMWTPRIIAYNVTQGFEIRLPDVDRIAALSREVSTLINEGVPVNSNPPEYLYTQLNAERVAMLAEATRDAFQRAESIANAVGAEVGAVRGASQGVFQVRARHSTDVSDYGIYDTSSIEKDITAVVRVTFAVD